MWTEWVGQNRSFLRSAAVVVPLLVSGMLYFLNGVVSGSASALVLVLVVVGAAATGDRIAGVLAGLTCAVGFDFFLTAPYLDLHITNSEDIELAVLLLLVGLAVNELALWGGRQSARASEREGFIRGVLESSDLVAKGGSGTETVDTVAGHIWHSLGAERVTFAEGPPSPDQAIVQRDGSVTLQGTTLDVASYGLPTDRFTAVPVVQGGRIVGHFQVTTATRLVKPTTEQLRVAVLLADQVARRRAPAAARHPTP
jgi:K+-sensing histidine kinase KdpD